MTGYHYLVMSGLGAPTLLGEGLVTAAVRGILLLSRRLVR
jgi:hypothetical protein